MFEALSQPLVLDGNNVVVAFMMIAGGTLLLRLDSRWWWRPTHDAVVLFTLLFPSWEHVFNVLCGIPMLVYFMRYLLGRLHFMSTEAVVVDLMRGHGVATHLYMMLLLAVIFTGQLSICMWLGDDYRVSPHVRFALSFVNF